MKPEFNDRIAAQRAVLRVVNKKSWDGEPLFGLSSKAIDRWVSVNRIEPGSQLSQLVKDVSGKLFFLANKSHEQISNEYQTVRAEISAACDAINTAIESYISG